MRLCEALGFPGEEAWPTGPSRVEFYAVALQLAEQFHRAGVRVSLRDLSRMTPLERDLLARAGDRVRARQSLDSAAAIQGRASEVAAVLDGGQALTEDDLSDWADLVEEQIGGCK